MSRLRPVSLAIVLLCAGLLGWQIAHRHATAPSAASSAAVLESTPPRTNSTRLRSQRDPELKPAASEESSNIDPVSVAPSSGASSVPPVTPPVPETLESSTLAPETVLQNLRTSLRQYAAVFGENPVGTNPEITSALQGQNPKQMSFLRADGNRINGNGELVDVWGTPYFFHQLSAHEMEIRSAGPDRRMYTADDLLTR